MTKYISLFGATTTDTQVQVVKKTRLSSVSVRVRAESVTSFTRWNTPPVATCTTWSIPKQRKSAKRTFCDPLANIRYRQVLRRREPRVQDAFEVALLVRQAEEQATAQAIAAAKEKAEHDRIAEIGRRGYAASCPKGCRA